MKIVKILLIYGYCIVSTMGMETSAILEGSQQCEDLKNTNLQCANHPITPEINGIEELLPDYLSRQFFDQLKDEYFIKITESYRSQFAAYTFFGGENLLTSEGGHTIALRRELQGIQEKCSRDHPDMVSGLLENLNQMDGKKELGLENIPDELNNKYQDFMQRRIIIAMLEAKRISLVMETYPLTDEEKQQYRERLENIRRNYPMIQASSRYGYSLRQTIQAHFGTSNLATSRHTHPEIDQILFPENIDGEPRFQEIEPQERLNNEAARTYNHLLFDELPEAVLDNLRSTFKTSAKFNAKAIADFCELTPCQLAQISPEATTQTLSSLPVEQQEYVHKELCACQLNIKRQTFGNVAMLGTAAVTVGGFILCPFTFGVGCYVGGASSVALVGMSVTNTVQAGMDAAQFAPTVSVVRHLPGLTDSERAEAERLQQDAQGRIILGVAETAIGLPGISAGFRAGTRVIPLNASNAGARNTPTPGARTLAETRTLASDFPVSRTRTRTLGDARVIEDIRVIPSVDDQVRYLMREIPEADPDQLRYLLDEARKKQVRIVFGGSRVRGNSHQASDLDIGFHSMTRTPRNLERIFKNIVKGANDTERFPNGLLIEDGIKIYTGNSTPSISTIVSPEEFFMRSGIREGPQVRAGEEFGASGYISVLPRGIVARGVPD